MKRLTNQIVSFILVMSMICSMGVTAFAAGPGTTIAGNKDMDCRIEDTAVNADIFNEDDICVIEEYTAQDEEGYFYVTDKETLSSILNSGQMDAVEQQIAIVNNQLSVQVTATEDGTEKHPYVLDEGKTKTVTAISVWFKCDVRGAADFAVSTATSGSSFTVYKKTLFGKKEVLSGTGTRLNETLSDCAINNNSNTFLISATSPKSARIGCTMKTHVDTKINSNGALWKPYNESAMYDTNILYFKYWYVDKTRIGRVRDMVTHSDFLENQSAVANGTLSLGMFLVGLGFPKTSTMLGIAGVVTAIKAPFDFQGDVLKEIDKVAGYQGNNSVGEAVYSSGCLIIEYMYDGMTFYEVKPWSGTTMNGPKGWTGSWSINA